MKFTKAMSMAVVASSVCSGAGAGELHVPEEHATIQAAVNAANTGDTVLVGPGSYAPFSFLGKSITVKSSAGAAATMIDAGGMATSAVIFGETSTFTTTLRGFTIRTGSGTIPPGGSWRCGGGVFMLAQTGSACAGTIEDCSFVGATGGCGYGAGVWTKRGSVAVRRCRFDNLSAQHHGPALSIDPAPSLTVPLDPTFSAVIEDCYIGHSSSYNNGGIVIGGEWTDLTGMRVRISRTDFDGNSGTYQAGALLIGHAVSAEDGDFEVLVDRCVFHGNNAQLAKSIGMNTYAAASPLSTLTVRGSIVADAGVAIFNGNGSMTISNTDFCGGPATIGGNWTNLGGNSWDCPASIDCDSDGMNDSYQVVLFPSTDLDGDGLLDSCYPPCLADIIQNGTVDAVDLAALLTVWGSNGGDYPRADIDHDGVVAADDLTALLVGWGGCP